MVFPAILALASEVPYRGGASKMALGVVPLLIVKVSNKLKFTIPTVGISF